MKHQSNNTLDSIRTSILALLDEAGTNYKKSNEISKRLGIKATSPDYELVRTALSDLESEGLILRTSHRRYGRKVPLVVIEGPIRNMKGRGWIVESKEKGGESLEIDGRLLWTAFDGDTVRAKMVVAPRPGKLGQGEVVSVLERGNDTVVGTLQQGRQIYLDPDARRIHRTITVNRKNLGGARIGDKVVLRLHKWTDPDQDPEGTVVERLGRAGEMNAEIESIAASYHLRHRFPDEVVAAAEEIPSAIPASEIALRRDLRDTTIITIDPHDARDFDDAVSIEEHPDGEVTLGIHIADVSHYVTEGSALDIEAYSRGTSVYLVTGVIPMLPERLSNDICSLRPNEDRLAYSVLVRLSPRGAIRSYEIVKSIINSKRRFSYEEALEVLETGTGDYANELTAINRMAHALRKARHRKGSVDFDRAELKFRLDENNHPVEVLQKRATESTRLIEDCMLLANRIVAEHVGKNVKEGGNPFIYRIHDVPPQDKLVELAAMVKELGFSLPTDNIQPKDIQKLLESVKGSEWEELVKETTLRSMAKAVYSEFNIGHFGLAFPHYTHFTSPIRRYPDLIVHRMLAEYAAGMSTRRRNEHASSLDGIARHCSERERAAVDAERESIKIAEVRFLKDHVGDEFEAAISGVMAFGIFAELKGLGIEGLVRMRSLSDDYYIYDERQRSFRGRHTGKVYRLGDHIHVRVIRVNEIASQIDMELIEEAEFRDGKVAEPTRRFTGRGDDRRSKSATQKPRGSTQKRAKSGESKRKSAGPKAKSVGPNVKSASAPKAKSAGPKAKSAGPNVKSAGPNVKSAPPRTKKSAAKRSKRR
jgi:ribonuclease R